MSKPGLQCPDILRSLITPFCLEGGREISHPIEPTPFDQNAAFFLGVPPLVQQAKAGKTVYQRPHGLPYPFIILRTVFLMFASAQAILFPDPFTRPLSCLDKAELRAKFPFPYQPP